MPTSLEISEETENLNKPKSMFLAENNESNSSNLSSINQQSENFLSNLL